MTNLFKSQRFQKWASVGILLFILVTLPLLIFEVKQRQVTTQRASNTHTGGAQDFPCGPVTIKVFANELINNSLTSQQCSSGSVANLTSYRSDFWIGLENGSSGNYSVTWTISKNFCPAGNKHPCIDIQSNIHGSGTLPASASTGWQLPNIGSACGFYQDDISFKVLNVSGQTVCQWGDLNNPATGNYCNSTGTCLANAYYAICAAVDSSGRQVVCTAVTPTNTPTPPPTNTPSPTNTPVPSPTNTPTPGVTITITPTSTPSATPTPPNTNTPVPSSTPTNGPTATPNPSSTPTNTPSPTNTPGPLTPTPTPKPTLPPTGPGNIFVNTGIAGIIIAIVGLFAAIGF